MKSIFTFLFALTACTTIAQKDTSFINRIQAIAVQGTHYFNVDGIEITKETLTNSFSLEDLKKPFRKYKIKKDDTLVPDTALPFRNYRVFKSAEDLAGVTQEVHYYFIEDASKWLTIVAFAWVKEPDVDFERNFLRLIYNNQLPNKIYTSERIDSINFAGRKIGLGSVCRWMGVNNVQCPYLGQVNWSVHKDSADAQINVSHFIAATSKRKGTKVITSAEVNVLFESVPVKATKIIYDITGVNSLLVGMSGGKTLTAYYVVAPVRGNYVSCIMSFWNNDRVNNSGLPSLLEEVMTLQ